MSFTGTMASIVMAGVHARSKTWIYVNAAYSVVDSELHLVPDRLQFAHSIVLRRFEGKILGRNRDMAVFH